MTRRKLLQSAAAVAVPQSVVGTVRMPTYEDRCPKHGVIDRHDGARIYSVVAYVNGEAYCPKCFGEMIAKFCHKLETVEVPR